MDEGETREIWEGIEGPGVWDWRGEVFGVRDKADLERYKRR